MAASQGKHLVFITLPGIAVSGKVPAWNYLFVSIAGALPSNHQ
ncbi:hypothetical protein PT974_01595 [Cladobotryum mycophilum]|uniref:Uncharacterized protein n=1 Tax=Cladobotryum mycophilum TaxID=491253 RepID=A0ABR0T4E8_9HYPO